MMQLVMPFRLLVRARIILIRCLFGIHCQRTIAISLLLWNHFLLVAKVSLQDVVVWPIRVLILAEIFSAAKKKKKSSKLRFVSKLLAEIYMFGWHRRRESSIAICRRCAVHAWEAGGQEMQFHFNRILHQPTNTSNMNHQCGAPSGCSTTLPTQHDRQRSQKLREKEGRRVLFRVRKRNVDSFSLWRRLWRATCSASIKLK